MTMFARLVLILSLAVLPGLGQAADPLEISWDTLAPPAVVIENPFETLTDDQMDTLRQILRFEALAERSDDAEASTEAQALRKQLAGDGLDVDGLFAARLAIMEKREAAASGVNEELVGTSVRLPGYVLPLEFKDRKAVEFLLVPTVGACVHTPPPPANQIVHVVYPEGIEVNGLFTPVWITGTMVAQSSVQKVGYVDGQAPVSVSYSMQPVLVEEYGG
ncbi:DUF3299 domain-containing protein [Primorskyibacter aestuariivivens]|uniref:DUF3299 domain-containing protein n=1 Tax=Primorskyibacter aestuariivivens TaxID=1888912 RepID=UPI0023015E48|nr:DUF3299 domain-containing protein [Primorskyibacter aestuariivivens]MDA7428863.1 DUF3299 domain-containing protein [Primorskyibacter aestuariivivens]